MPGFPFEIGETIAAKYRVDSILGQGGMGVVVVAHHLELDQKVAIKFLLQDLSERSEAAERFRREARAAAKIQSDHVVRVIDVSTLDGGVPYMVMEYLEGRDLSQVIDKENRPSAETAVGYLLEALEAVSEAHAVGVVHRDLKPANIFLARRPDGTERIKVLDFGISKSLLEDSSGELRLTATSTLIGSPLYMSPEQMQSARDVDARADIWSLGAILYELLTGRPPYVADTLPQLCNALLQSDAPPLRNFNPEIPYELEQVVLRCLARDRVHRWPDAVELATALAPFAAARKSLHVDRVRSISTTKDVSGFPPASSAALRESETIHEKVQASTGDQPKTLQAWSGTEDDADKRPRRRAVLWGGLALVTVLGGAVIYAATRTPEGGTEPEVAAPPLDSAEAPVDAPPPKGVGAELEATPVQPYQPPPEDSAGDMATTSDGPAPTPQATRAPRPSKLGKARKPPEPEPEPTVPKKGPASAPGSLPDFGGRR